MATKIFIDGYNFLWQERIFRDEAIRGHDKGREAVLKWLTGQARLGEFEVTVVFDAYKTDSFHPTAQAMQGIQVVFTAGGQSADDYLREAAALHGPAAIIVSSDREVMRHAEKKGCGVLGSREFQDALQNAESLDLDPSRKLPKGKRKALNRLLKNATGPQ